MMARRAGAESEVHDAISLTVRAHPAQKSEPRIMHTPMHGLSITSWVGEAAWNIFLRV